MLETANQLSALSSHPLPDEVAVRNDDPGSAFCALGVGLWQVATFQLGKYFQASLRQCITLGSGSPLLPGSGDTRMSRPQFIQTVASTAFLLLATSSLSQAHDSSCNSSSSRAAPPSWSTAHPYFLLGAQVDNSSGWPARLDAVWPAAEALRLNTLEVPVYWEQMEPTRGTFDFTVVDAILQQARDPQHAPRPPLVWHLEERQDALRPRLGKVRPCHLSAHALEIRRAHRRSQPQLPRQPRRRPHRVHCPHAPPQGTPTRSTPSIMMQVENESGSLGLVRDFSPMAQKIFDAPVPSDLLKALDKKPGTWSQVFGDDADETFAAWSVSRYINALRRGRQARTSAAHVRQQLAQEPARLPRHHRSRRRLSLRRPHRQHASRLEGDGPVHRPARPRHLRPQLRALSRRNA